jgi:hypothetical protein
LALGILQRLRPRRKAITASAERIDLMGRASFRLLQERRQSWQERMFDFYRSVGELQYAADFFSHSFSRVSIVPAIQEGDDVAILGEEAPEEALAIVRDLGQGMNIGHLTGQPAMMARLGHHLFLVGETHLLGTQGKEGNAWDVLSISELVPMGSRFGRRDQPGATPQVIPDESLLVRIWRPDPQWSALGYAPTRGVMGRLEELSLLSAKVMANTLSRIPAKLLFVPEELRVVDEKGQDVFTSQLIEALSTAIQDPASASAVVPFVLRGKADLGEKIKPIDIASGLDEKDMERRRELIERVAHGLTLPTDFLTPGGLGEANHWNGLLITEQCWAHIEPYVVMALDGLTQGWYRQALREMGVADWRHHRLWYDDAELVARPDKGDAATQGLDRLLISERSWRREHGFAEEDAPSPEEYERRLELARARPATAPSSNGRPPQEILPPPSEGLPSPSLPALPAGASINGRKTPRFVVTRSRQAAPALVAAAPRRSRAESLGEQLASIDRDLRERLAAGVDAAVRRALERAGARLRSFVRGNGRRLNLQDTLRGVPNARVASAFGPTMIRTLGLEEDDLLEGLVEEFTARAEGWMAASSAQALRRLARALEEDVEELEARLGPRLEERRREAVAALAASLAVFAKAKLYAPETPPAKGEWDDLLAPRSAIRAAVAVAGGSEPAAEGGSLAGLATGPIALEAARERGLFQGGWRWEYGTAPRIPFPSHEELDGLEFSSWDDPALEVRPEDGWMVVSFYSPGDHPGCACGSSPVLFEG